MKDKTKGILIGASFSIVFFLLFTILLLVINAQNTEEIAQQQARLNMMNEGGKLIGNYGVFCSQVISAINAQNTTLLQIANLNAEANNNELIAFNKKYGLNVTMDMYK